MIHPLAFTWPYAPVFWLPFLWAFAPEFGVLTKAPKSASDAGSMRVIMALNQLAMFGGFGLAWAAFGTMPARFVMFGIGVSLLVAGSLLRRHCFRVLGKFFTGSVAVQSDHSVVDQGAYRWVRHPSYTGGMIMFLGIGLALGNWMSVALLVVLPAVAYAYRVRVEERALLAQLGEPYRVFMRTRKRFIPFVV